MLGGMAITVSEYAVQRIGRWFPESRHRSRRILKKLIKRHGGEWITKPAAFQTRQGLIIHPALYAEVKTTLGRHA